MPIKFEVTGTISIEVTAVIEADTEADAKDMFDSADCCVESCDESITFTDCSQSASDVDDVKCPAADKWEGLSRLERAIILKDNGVDHEEAFDISERDYLTEIDEEWWSYFDE
jgi:hypothetical protein